MQKYDHPVAVYESKWKKIDNKIQNTENKQVTKNFQPKVLYLKEF